MSIGEMVHGGPSLAPVVLPFPIVKKEGHSSIVCSMNKASKCWLDLVTFSPWICADMAVSTSEMALDDIKKADEIISMAVLGHGNNNQLGGATTTTAATSVSPSPNAKRRKFLSTLSLGSQKKKRPQRQYSNAFPCPIIRSDTLDSPEGSMSSLGLVHSTPFATLAMTSVHAKRARNAFRSSRTISDQAAHTEV